MTKHKVLVPLDGSDFGRQITPSLCRLLQPECYQLILLRVGELPEGLIGAPPRPLAAAWPLGEYATVQDAEHACHPIYATQTEQNARADLSQALVVEQRTLEAAGYTVATMVRFGDPAQEIVDIATSMQIDMIAMATHSRTGVSKFMIGSVTEQVLHKLTIPLLLVHPHGQALPHPTVATPHTIVVPLDGSAFAEQALEAAQTIAAAAGATLVLVAATQIQEDVGLAAAGVVPYWMLAENQANHERLDQYLKSVAARLASKGFKVSTRIIADRRPADAILRVGEEDCADLIVMATHGRSGLSRLLLGSVAAQVLQDADRAVLLVRPQMNSPSTQTERSSDPQNYTAPAG